MSNIPRIRMRDVARIYDALNMGIIVTDGNGTIIWGNSYYSFLAGFNIEDYYGCNVRDISAQGKIHLPTNKTMIDYVIENRKAETQIVRYHTNDYVITNATPIFSDASDNIDYIIYVITNFTELNKLQESLSISHAHVQALQDQLKNMQITQNLGDDIVIADKTMYNIYGKAQRLANTSVAVMLTGESGCGKDVLARYLHKSSTRADGNFIHVNMATIPKPLFESELFGYTPGSFSGASRDGKAGLIKLADKGTLFLDEIGELPMDIQAKLLQVIQNKELRAIGAVEAVHVDFRIICATNRDLKQMVNNGTFRLDLYYRLNAVELYIPPLRERKADIPLLTNLFLKQYNTQENTKKYLAPNVIQAFQTYSWPGNVRELQHIIEGLIALSPSDMITIDQLPPEFNVSRAEKQSSPTAIDLKDSVKKYEIGLIRSVLERCDSASQAAEELGIDPSTLCKKRKRYGI